MEVTRELLASGGWPRPRSSQWFHHHRAAIDRFEEVARGGDVLGHAIARRVALRGDLKETIVLVDLETLDASGALAVKCIGQA
jgi:hypothetical protein